MENGGFFAHGNVWPWVEDGPWAPEISGLKVWAMQGGKTASWRQLRNHENVSDCDKSRRSPSWGVIMNIIRVYQSHSFRVHKPHLGMVTMALGLAH